MQFNMNHFWSIQDWLSELPEEDVGQFTSYIMTKGTVFVVECEDEKLLHFMALRWGELVDK
jgi:hypothetical protein